MIFLELMARYGRTVEDCCVVTMGTEGLDPGFDQPICVTTMQVAGDTRPRTHYISGADVYSTQAHTGIQELVYYREAVTRPMAASRLMEELAGSPVLIGHNERFLKGFLTALCPALEERTYLGTQPMAQYLYSEWPAALKAGTFRGFLAEAGRSIRPAAKSGWALHDLCKFEPAEVCIQPEVNAVRTKALFIYLLGREVPIPDGL